MFKRNGIEWNSEEDYDEYVVNETRLIILNTEEFYNIYMKHKTDKTKLKSFISFVMSLYSFRVKKKNVERTSEMMYDEEE